MSTITTRSGKGSPLTNNEVDANFTNLNTDKLESGDLSVVTTAAGTAALAYNSGVFTYTPPDLTAIDLSLYAPLAGAVFTGTVEAPLFEGDLSGAQLFPAKAGEALTKGDALYISGISGNKPVVMKADANDPAKMPSFGLAGATVSNNASVNCVTYGQIHNLDTTAFSLGDQLYVSTTPGALVNTAPSGETSQIQNLGKVERVHQSAGALFVAGSGRANATPNLNDGNFFLGNASNQSVSTDFTTAVLGEISAGTGIGLSGGVISNTAPDQTVALTGAGATSISGTYPNFTITSTDTVYTLPFADNSANWNTAYGWGDHSTESYATETYVGTAISNLVDSSPTTLDTLNELAAALGDDPNFATTVTNNIATKLPLAGGTLTGGLTGTTATFSGNAQVGGALRITEAGTAQNLLMGNQDSGGTNKPAMIMGVNGYLRFGHGSSWSGEGGTFTEKLRVDNDTDVISGNFQIGSTTVIDSSRNLTNIGTVTATSIDLPSANNWSYIKNNAASGGLRFGTKNAAGTYSDQIEISATGGYVKLNRNTTVSGTVTATGGNSTNWNTAYGWGNHASAGYYPASNPNGYTNDQTAAEILTAIKTVDGSGSGLDADLLDGINSVDLFNNMGEGHTTRTSFDATTASYNFGWRFIQGNTNGPSTNASQYYSQYVGLGTDYPATGSGSYGMYVAYDRDVINPYISIRYNQNNSLSAWTKISAGKADSLTTARTINGVSFDGTSDITVADSTKLPLAGGTLTGKLGLGVAANTTNFLRIARQTGHPNIKSSDPYMFMDSNGSQAGLNWYTSDNVSLANGGGAVHVGGSSPSERLQVNGNLRVDGALKISSTTVISSSRAITGSSLSDGFITWSFAQMNRYGAAIELQYTPTNAATFVKIGGNGSNPTTFNAFTGDASFSGTISITGGKLASYAADANAPYFADGGNVGIRLSQAGTDDIQPCSTAGANRPDAINLGAGDNRFRDIHLSGTYHVGSAGVGKIQGTVDSSYFPIVGSPSSGAASIYLNGATRSGFAGHLQLAGSNIVFFNETLSQERMRLTSTGLGIGTTSSPTAKLEVTGVPNATIQPSNAIIKMNSSGGNGLYMGNVGASTYASYIQSAYVAADSPNVNYNLLLQPNGGNVGIGDSSPSVKLDVYQSTAGIGTVDFRHVNGNRILINPSYNYHDAYNHIFRGLNGTSTHMTIDNLGNVGIGATVPNTRLQIASSGANAYSSTLTKGGNHSGLTLVQSNNANDMVGVMFGTGSDTDGTHWSGITGSRSDNVSHWGTQLNFYTHNEDVTALNDATRKMVITGAGDVTATGSFRAPLFYDSNNTAYYVDPAGVSNFGGDVVLSGGHDIHLVKQHANNAVDMVYGQLTFGDTTTGQYINHARIESGGTYANQADLRFHTSSNNSSPERMRITNVGDVNINTGALQLGGTTVIDSSRNLTNVTIKQFTPSAFSPYISPTNANTLNAGWGQDTDIGDMWINYRGYQDGWTRFRDFRIGDGKGTALLFVDGSTKAFDFQAGSFLQINGQTIIDSNRNLTNIGTVTATGNVSANGTTIGADGTYAGYSVIGFSGTTNGYNRVFGHNSNADGLYLAAATGRGIIFRVNGSGSNSFAFNSAGNFQLNNTTVIDSSRNLTNINTCNVSGLMIAAGGITLGQTSVGYNQADTFTYDGIAHQQYGVTFKPSKVVMSGYAGLGLFTNTQERLSISSTGNVTIQTDIRSPIFYDSDSTDFYANPSATSRLNVVNANAFGQEQNSTVKIFAPNGAARNGNGTEVGAIKVTLPQSWTNTMMSMVIKVYDYADNESFDVHCGGYNYSGATWVNTFAYILGSPRINRNFNVRFGHDGTKCCIYIGETSDSWSYLKVAVTEFFAGHSSSTVSNWGDGWDVNLVTSFLNVSAAQSNVQIGRTSSIFYDADNTGYYVDPNSTSNLNILTTAGDITAGGRVYLGGTTTTSLSTGPYSSTNMSLNCTSSIFLYSGSTQMAFFSTNNAWFNKRTVIDGRTTTVASTPNIRSIAETQGNGVTQYHIHFENSVGAVHGRITTNNFSTTYATTSDYRVKEDVQEMEGATERLLQLNPVNFKWKGSEVRTDGFLAHEVDLIVPEAVVGAKDATEEVTDDEGITTTVDSLQALDQAKLIPLLIKTIQELEARITALENA